MPPTAALSDTTHFSFEKWKSALLPTSYCVPNSNDFLYGHFWAGGTEGEEPWLTMNMRKRDFRVQT